MPEPKLRSLKEQPELQVRPLNDMQPTRSSWDIAGRASDAIYNKAAEMYGKYVPKTAKDILATVTGKVGQYATAYDDFTANPFGMLSPEAEANLRHQRSLPLNTGMAPLTGIAKGAKALGTAGKITGNVKTKTSTASKAQQIIKFAEEQAAAKGGATYNTVEAGAQRALPAWGAPWTKARPAGIVNNTFHSGPAGTAVTQGMERVGPRVRTGNPGAATSTGVQRYANNSGVATKGGTAPAGSKWGKTLAELAAVTAGAGALVGGYQAMTQDRAPLRSAGNAAAPSGSQAPARGAGSQNTAKTDSTAMAAPKYTPPATKADSTSTAVPQYAPPVTKTDSTSTKKAADGSTTTTTKTVVKPDAPKEKVAAVTPAVDKAVEKISGSKTIPETAPAMAPVVVNPLPNRVPSYGEQATDYSDNMSAADLERMQGIRDAPKAQIKPLRANVRINPYIAPPVNTKQLATRR